MTGVARGCQLHQESRDSSTSWQVLSFRLDRFDDAGRPLPSIPVEMRGLRLEGYVNDGEWIELPGRYQGGQLVQARRVRNLTTGSWVRIAGRWIPIVRLLVFLGFLTAALVGFWLFYQWAQQQYESFGGRSSSLPAATVEVLSVWRVG